MARYWEEFNDPERYEADKPKRLMPQNLVEEELYVFRFKNHVSSDPFAWQYFVTLVKAAWNGRYWEVAFTFRDDEDGDEHEVEIEGQIMADGFYVHYPGQENQQEIGYLIGCADALEVDELLLSGMTA